MARNWSLGNIERKGTPSSRRHASLFKSSKPFAVGQAAGYVRILATDRASSLRAGNMGKDFYPGLATQMRCVGALMVRDMMKRYGRANIGFLWIVLEPLLLTAGVMLIWSLLKSPYEHGVPILAFVLTGYLPLTLWRHISNAGVHVFRQNAGVLYHRHLTLLDVLMARFALEFVGTTSALLLVSLVLMAAGVLDPPLDPGLALLGWCSMGFLSLGFAANIAILTEYSEVTERLVQPLQYVILPISGFLFMAEWLPKSMQTIALYNPTVHCYEMFRAGYLGEAVPTHYTVWYPWLCGLVLLAIAMATLDSVRSKLHAA